MITKKEKELKPMEFKDLTSDFIMSQMWRCDNPDYGGVFIDYPSAMLGRVTECGILSPNSNFKYPEVYQRLCERICEEHNENLRRIAPQWSQEPPTEKGLYWLFYKDKRVLVEIYYDGYMNECGLYVKNLAAGWSSFSHRLDTFVCNEPHLQWCKVVPPPLPTEGRAE